MVFEDVTKAWERAVTRAMARGVNAFKVSETRDGYDSTVRYAVSSHSHPGCGHMVSVHYSGDGVETHCDCQGAQHGRCCQHAAAALLAEGLLPLQPVPQPAQPKPVDQLAHYRAVLARDEADPQFGNLAS